VGVAAAERRRWERRGFAGAGIGRGAALGLERGHGQELRVTVGVAHRITICAVRPSLRMKDCPGARAVAEALSKRCMRRLMRPGSARGQ